MSNQQIKGIAGKTLRVNLTNGTIVKEDTDSKLFRNFLGGRGVGAAILYKELAPGVDPLGPDNKLVFAVGLLEGTMAPGANKITVSFKSPATNTICWSLAGGHVAPELKFAGYDGIIIEGKSPKPVYLSINGDNVELKDASALWRKETHDTEDAIRAELKEPMAKVITIGPAGENQVAFACIQADYYREFGRGGGGSVMGSKNLKAIAVRGRGYIEVHNPDKLAEVTDKVNQILANHPKAQARKKFGTNEMIEGINSLGFWSVRNFQHGYFDGVEQINSNTFKKDVVFSDASCYGCSIVCGKNSRNTKNPYFSVAVEGPEFETLSLLGADCGINSWNYVIKASDICDRLGMDSISAGAVVAFAMELYEKGIITKETTDGLELKFGNGEALCQMLESIAYRRGFGDTLANGSKSVGEKFNALNWAPQVKGLEFAAYDPRGAKGMGLTYATSPKGAHHMTSPTMGVEIAQNNRFSEGGKGAMVAETQQLLAIVDSMILCASMRFALNLTQQLELLEAVTGIAITDEEGLQIGKNILTIERLFNDREGFTRKDDDLPKRFLEEQLVIGASAGHTVNLEPMLDEYYAVMGFDKDGKPFKDNISF